MTSDNKVNVIVTGANSGVGLGICKRILEQFSLVSPTDSNSQHSNLISNIKARGLRLILACRSKDKATNAINELKTHLNEVLISRSSNENVNSFISLLELQFECLDLSSVESCKIFSNNLRSKYKSLSSIICNAGNGSFTGIDWVSAIKQVVLHPVDGLTYPNYKLQSKGEKTDDNLGWVFQTNIFGHFILIKELQFLLEAEFNNYGTQSSVLWMSSLEAGKFDYDISDFQLLNNDKSYECSKYLTEALAIGLNDYYSSQGLNITSYIVHPGVVWSSIFYQHLGWILDLCMAFAFYLARLIGSQVHCINSITGAVSVTSTLINEPQTFNDYQNFIRFASYSNRFGQGFVVNENSVVVDDNPSSFDVQGFSLNVLNEFEILYKKYL